MTRGDRLRFLPSPLANAKAAASRARSITWLLRRNARTHSSGFRILHYHRISDDPDPLAVKPAQFRAQMDFLAGNGYEVVGLEAAGRLLNRSEDYSHRVVALTFDDGYLDVAHNALPVLAEYGFRATVFVVTEALNGKAKFPWYDHCPPLLSWRDVVELDLGSPLRFASHSATHPNLLTLDDLSARKEIADSKRDLEDHLDRPVEAFSYPVGLFGSRERTFADEAGYEFAVSCEPGLNETRTDALALRRTLIESRDRALDFAAKVGGGHDAPLPLRRLSRRVRYGAS